ncbi:hypothetical protein Tco_1039692 [Tanacetum coccineum]
MPSPTNDPEGYKVVTEFILHDPCGKGAACTVDGKCSKKYPKPFYPETNLDEDRYPVYRCRDLKIQTVKGKFMYDNKYFIPNNRYLLIKYQAHINVEWCNRSKAIKYLFKYLNKGPDRATFVIQENVQNGPLGELQKVASVDEIKNYLNCRYLALCEAVWRLFSFEIHYSCPSVMMLNFHLKDQHTITLRDSENLPALLNRGPQGFKELTTVNKKLYPTFKAVCFAYGLLNDDKECAHAINESSFWALAPQLHDLFVTMLLFCDVSRPLRLWEETWELLSQDILLKKRKLYKYLNLQLKEEQIKNYCLVEIEALLNRKGRSLADFQELLRPNPALLTKLDNRLIREAMDFDIKQSKLEHD